MYSMVEAGFEHSSKAGLFRSPMERRLNSRAVSIEDCRRLGATQPAFMVANAKGGCEPVMYRLRCLVCDSGVVVFFTWFFVVFLLSMQCYDTFACCCFLFCLLCLFVVVLVVV